MQIAIAVMLLVATAWGASYKLLRNQDGPKKMAVAIRCVWFILSRNEENTMKTVCFGLLLATALVSHGYVCDD
jgi:hypothetical protein